MATSASTVAPYMPPSAPEAVPAFFTKHALKAQDWKLCLSLIRSRLPARCTAIEPLAGQGGCSYTLVARETAAGRQAPPQATAIVVQCRLRKHALSLRIARAARKVYGDLAPELLWVEDLVLSDGGSLQACAMSFVQGVSFADVQPHGRERLGELEIGGARRLMAGLAGFFAMGWKASVAASCRSGMQQRMTGRVGSSIRDRLLMLERGLPSPKLRKRARRVRLEVLRGRLDVLPVVLNHGDLLPGNLLVDPNTWAVSGLVDWAEAEYLPFGISLHGIEHLLGWMEEVRDPPGRFIFVSYDQASELRQLFWEHLKSEIRDLARDHMWRAAMVAREVGILLWHGIAWDDGRLSRVINSADDARELAYLEAFPSAFDGAARSRL